MDEQDQPRHSRRAVKIALVSAGVIAGAIGATALGANAASNTTNGTGYAASGSTSGASTNAPAAPPKNNHQSTPVRSDEKAVTGALYDKLKAAALKAVPGGTVYRIETDAGDGVYEAHMTKADGTEVTVKFDKNGAVTKVESGMGQGDPRPAGGPNGPGGPHH